MILFEFCLPGLYPQCFFFIVTCLETQYHVANGALVPLLSWCFVMPSLSLWSWQSQLVIMYIIQWRSYALIWSINQICNTADIVGWSDAIRYSDGFILYIYVRSSFGWIPRMHDPPHSKPDTLMIHTAHIVQKWSCVIWPIGFYYNRYLWA